MSAAGIHNPDANTEVAIDSYERTPQYDTWTVAATIDGRWLGGSVKIKLADGQPDGCEWSGDWNGDDVTDDMRQRVLDCFESEYEAG